MTKNIFLSIESTIGGGKSTLLRNLESLVDIPIVEENVTAWKYLQPYYQDRKKYAFLLQREILEDFQNLSRYSSCIMERCSKTSLEVFTRMNVDDGYISLDQFRHLQQLEEEICVPPTHYFYIDMSPELAFERIQKRGRDAEKEIDLAYLLKLDSYYRTYINKLTIPGISIHCTAETTEQQVCESLVNFLEEIQR